MVSNTARNLLYYSQFWVERQENIEDALAKAKLVYQLEPRYISQVAGVYVDAGRPEYALEIYGPDFVKENKDSA